MLKSLSFIFILLFLFSCGKNADEKLNEALLDAQIALGSGDCQHAIDTLETHGRVNTNAHYLKTLASAYACRAGYSTPKFFASDLALTATHPPLGGTSVYSTSGVAVSTPMQTDSAFMDLETAINILMYAGNIGSTTEPTATERAKRFSSTDAGEINSQLLFMELVQLGKYLRVYGNGSATGLKGSGTAGNKCLTSYSGTIAAVQALLVGTCNGIALSHAQLDISVSPATVRKTRLCHGVVLLNGVFDLLPSVVGSAAGGSLGAASGLTTLITAVKTILVAVPGVPATLANALITVNQAKCEDDTFVSVPAIETYFAGMMEKMYP